MSRFSPTRIAGVLQPAEVRGTAGSGFSPTGIAGVLQPLQQFPFIVSRFSPTGIVGVLQRRSPASRRVKKLILAAKQSEETSRGCKPRLSNPFEFLDHRGMIKSPDSRCHASNTVRHLSNGRRKRYRKRRS